MSGRVIIAGSRSFDDYGFLMEKVDGVMGSCGISKPFTVLCGMAKGADLLGKKYAEDLGVDVEEYPADWENHGRSAGIIRNSEMARKADVLVAFWDGKSRGTKHMIMTALAKGLEVHVYQFEK